MGTKFLSFVVGIFLCFPSAAFAQKFPSNITSQLQIEDKRLETPVSLNASHISLGELLEKLTAQTGVSMSMNPNGSFSGIPITIVVDRVPLINVMNGLWSLLGCRNALWEWTYSPEIEKRRYTFEPSRAFNELAARLNNEMQDAFEAQAALMVEMAFMSPKERQNNVARLAKSMLEKDNHIANFYVADNPSANRKWEGLRLFARTLSSAQRLSVLRGNTISVPISQLAGEAQTFAKSLAGKSKSFVNGVEQSPVAPSLLRFSLSRYMGKHKELSAKLMIGAGGQEGFQSRSYIGVLEFGLRRQIEERWLLPGDKKTHAPASQKITPPEKKKQGSTLIFRPLAAKLAEAAEAVPFSFMAVLPDAQESNQPTLQGKTLEEVLAEWRKDVPEPMYKWRDDVLLMSYPAWFYGDDAQSSYGLTKRLYASAQANKGFLPLAVFAEIVATLEPAQWERLSEKFHDLESARHFLPLFALAKVSPEILSVQGLAVNESVRTFLSINSLLPSFQGEEALQSIRIAVQKKAKKDGQFENRVSLEMRTNRRGWFAVTGFVQVPVKPKSVSQ